MDECSVFPLLCFCFVPAGQRRVAPAAMLQCLKRPILSEIGVWRSMAAIISFLQILTLNDQPVINWRF
jgi:hypothetical protein